MVLGQGNGGKGKRNGLDVLYLQSSDTLTDIDKSH